MTATRFIHSLLMCSEVFVGMRCVVTDFFFSEYVPSAWRAWFCIDSQHMRSPHPPQRERYFKTLLCLSAAFSLSPHLCISSFPLPLFLELKCRGHWLQMVAWRRKYRDATLLPSWSDPLRDASVGRVLRCPRPNRTEELNPVQGKRASGRWKWDDSSLDFELIRRRTMLVGLILSPESFVSRTFSLTIGRRGRQRHATHEGELMHYCWLWRQGGYMEGQVRVSRNWEWPLPTIRQQSKDLHPITARNRILPTGDEPRGGAFSRAHREEPTCTPLTWALWHSRHGSQQHLAAFLTYRTGS